ncbi:MAG: InlB B-repeat-containing protein [Ruminococcus sp.]|nr:InlB B-repeat-containing protein [Ruminococcus sp.]
MKHMKLTHILRALTAMVLALILMLGTVTTTLAAVVDDNAETGAVSFSVKKGMTIYLDITRNVNNDANNNFLTNSQTPRFRFNTSASDTDAVECTVDNGLVKLAKDGSGSNVAGLYYAEVPADGYNYVNVDRYSGGYNASGWKQITGAQTNTLIFKTDWSYDGLQLPYNDGSGNKSGGYGHIYFDNTTTNWTIDATNNLYFVIGRDNYQAMYEMSAVNNTDQLYYLASNTNWNDYTFFGFAVATSAHTGSYGPNDSSNGVLNVASAYTTFASMYELAGQNKSFLGTGLNSGNVSALDILWISDNQVGSSSGSHENEYLNRGQKLTVTGRGSATISGYKATAVGSSGVTAQSATTVSSNSDSTVYYARSSTVTLSGITPNAGYELTGLTVNGTDVLSAYNNGGGSYTYTVPGGDDNDSSDIPVNVTFTKTGATDVFLLGLWETGKATKTVWEANSTNNSDRLMNYASSLTVGNETLTNVYYLDMVLTGNKTYSSSESETVDGTDIQNGFKIYDADLDNPWLSNSGTYTSGQSWWSLSDTSNCALTTITPTGSATYRFVYDPNHSIDNTTKPCVKVYYPQIVTYNNNESTAVSGGTTSADTTSQLIVTYGGTAKNITPVRDGYAFGGWYDDRACTTAHDFTAAVTGAVTVYAKWTVNTVNVKVHGTQNGVDMNDAVTKTVNGITGTQINANAAASGYVFRGWVVSGSMASHIKLYTDSACTTVYTAGTAVNQLYVKTDGASGITVDNAIITAIYVTNNTVKVDDGKTAKSTAEEYYTSISGKTTNSQNFDFGSAITVAFDDLPAGFGIESVTFADGESVEYTNYGHYIAFDMPAHNVTITDMTVTPFTCRITVKNSDTIDIDGLSSSGYYSTGADVHTITIKGSDDYYGTSVLNSLTVKYIGGTAITVSSSNTTASTTFDGSTLNVVYDDATHTATITGHIGGNVVLTPECSTQYNVNITSKVMSDVSSKYITYNKKTTTADGTVESVTVADLKAYIKLNSAPGSKEAAEAADVKWPLESTTYNGNTYYLIEADEDGDYIGKFDADSKILLKTENLNSNYTFIGWFGGSSTGPELTAAKSTNVAYEYTLGESSFLYGVVTRDIYIGGQGPSGNSGFNVSWSNASKMTYDEKNQVYYYETGSLWSSDNNANNYYFKIFDQASTGNSSDSGTSNQAVWYNAAKTIAYNQDYGVRLSGHTSTGTNEKATFQLYHSDSAYQNIDSDKVRIYYKPSSQEVYIIPVFNSNYHEVYLSNGRIDGMTKLGLTLTTPTQAFTTPSSGTSTGTTVNNGQTENYTYYKFTNSTTVDFKVTIDGTSASDVKVAGFVVYNMDSGSASTVTATKSGNVYSGSATISANTFICPVYELTDSYISSNSIQAFEVFVNAADVDTAVWGDLVSMYVFGGSGQARDYNGAWPGQLMLPEGKTFSGTIYKKSGEDLSGIVFENYNSYGSFFGKFGKRFNYPDWAQTYDYLEPITLMGDGSNADTTMLSFSLKQNNDGYRGEYYTSRSKKQGPYYLDVYNEENNEAKPGVVYSYYDEGLGETQTLFDNYTFEYLTDKDGKNRLNLYGDSVGSASAGYYVICVGDTDYLNNTTQNGKTYDPATSYNGEYSVEWYVYDSDGVFLLHTLSDALYGRNDASENSYIVDKLLASGLIKNPTTLKEKSVKISYEAPNKRDDATRFSGQWYANSTNEKVTVYAGVGMITDGGMVIVPENPQSSASYGSAAISFTSAAVTNGATQGTVTGLNWGSLTLSDASKGSTTLTATIPSTSTFKGWYSYNETTDSYTKVSDGTASGTTNTYSPKFGTESRFFAMFSAQATYYFTYPGRKGTVTYSVKASLDPKSGEMSSGGYLDLTDSDRVADIQAQLTNLNKIHVFNHNVTFNLNETANMDNSSPYEITVEGTSQEATYALTVYSYNSQGTLELKGTVTGTFSTELNVTTHASLGNGTPLTENKPSDKPNGVFLGWKKYVPGSGGGVTGDYLSTQANFGYSICENLTIAPVFGTAAERTAIVSGGTWRAGIDKNVVTQELTNASTGTIYCDTLANFRNTGATGTRFDTSTNECGVVYFFQTAEATANSTASTAFGNISEETLQGLVSTMSSRDLGTAKLKESTYNCGEAYAYRVKATELSALNRADFVLNAGYGKFVGANYKVIAYTKIVSGENVAYTYSTIVSNTFTHGQKFPVLSNTP